MKENQFRNKICWFTFAFSILVIWVHSFNSELFLGRSPANIRISRLEYWLGGTVAQVSVPGFFMISAYLFYRNFSWNRLWPKWSSRIRSILIPFILWNAIYYLGYLIASRIPYLSEVVGRGTVPYSLSGLTEAILHYTYNPVFWYLYQLILLILAAPLLYPVLKNRLTAAAALAVMAFALFHDFPLSPLNLDALFYYSVAAAAAIHGRGIVEGPWNRTKGIVGAGLLLGCIYCCSNPLLPARAFYTVLFRLLVPMGLWLFVSETWLPEASFWMKDNFFLYAVHFALVRLVNKAGAMVLPHAPAVPLILYLLMPLLVIPVSTAGGWLLKRFAPRLWRLLNGGR